ncbi:mechanosensitive ion channel, partial [Candidatus Babeliales bacterium]|nr:mechanosensitive ion channel [Candidatus Babeliales bacterium]
FSFVVLPPYFKALFYLVSIPLFILYSKRLLESLGTLNQRLSYLFFNEASQSEAMRLIASALYSGSVLLPFRTAFLHYGPTGSQFASILLAAYTLILLVVVLLFFNKDDILSLLPRRGPIFGWLKQQIERFYYPTFFSFVGLLIIANPYIGYSNLAWFLAFAVPTSIFLIVGFFAVHHYVREYSLFIFIKEGDEGAEDRFDHAKMLYGFFVVLTFLMTVSMCFLVLSRIWGAPYTGPQLWEMISQEWVIPLKTGEKFGLVQFLIFFMFMMAGYLISSLFKKMLLGQLFEVFRIESGAQNTIARIAQYVIIMVFTTLGLAVVNLSAYVVYALGLLLLGVGLGIKDQLADIFAGILILLERHIEIGHYVNTDTAEGTVHSISLRSTVIRTARNFFIVIPNRSLIAKPIVNWGRGRVAVGMEIKVNVAYGTDIELIRSIMREVLYSHPLILRVPSVVVRLEEFEESGMQIFSRSYISARKVREMWAIASDVRTAILKMFKQHKIHIPFPQHVVHMVDDRYGVGGNLSIKFDENAASPQGVQEQK